MLYIYQFSSKEGGREYLYLQDHKLDKDELEDITPAETELDQIVECDIISGDDGVLPLDRALKH